MSDVALAGALAALAAMLCVASLATAETRSVVDRLTGPAQIAGRSLRRSFLGALGRSAFGRRLGREQLSERIASSGWTWTSDEIAGVKLAALVSLFPFAVAPTPLPLVGVPLALVTFRLPDIALSRAAQRIRRSASSEVPLFLDLLAVTSSAGLAPQVAVRVAAEQVRGPLGDELRHALRLADLGTRWRDALTAAAERLALPDLRRAVTLVQRTEALGGSTAEEIARLAADVRSERRARAAERARTAPVKMLFPLVFLILPAFLLLTVVPVLLTTVSSIR